MLSDLGGLGLLARVMLSGIMQARTHGTHQFHFHYIQPDTTEHTRKNRLIMTAPLTPDLVSTENDLHDELEEISTDTTPELEGEITADASLDATEEEFAKRFSRMGF